MSPKVTERHERDRELIKIGKTWYYRGTPTPGAPEMMKSLKVTTPGLAVQAKKKLLIELRGVDSREAPVLFQDLAIEVLKIQSTKAPATYTMAKLQLEKHLLPFFGLYPVDRIDEATWEDYVGHSRDLDSDRKLEHDRRHLTMVMKRAWERGLVKRPIQFRKPDTASKSGRVFTDDEIRRLLDCANDDLQLQILMAFTMGMRKSEILGLTWDRVFLSQAFIKLRAEDTKTRRGREVPISGAVLAVLEVRDDKSGPVFGGRYNNSEVTKSNKTSWTSCKNRAGVVGRFHDLRHSFLTRAFRQPINPALICDFAGLSMEVAQSVYLHFTPDDKRAVAGLVGVPA